MPAPLWAGLVFRADCLKPYGMPKPKPTNGLSGKFGGMKTATAGG